MSIFGYYARDNKEAIYKNRSIETRRENISNIASVNAELKESISKQLSKRDQIAMMISDGEVSEEPIQKVI